jgi:hypothetical protein
MPGQQLPDANGYEEFLTARTAPPLPEREKN